LNGAGRVRTALHREQNQAAQRNYGKTSADRLQQTSPWRSQDYATWLRAGKTIELCDRNKRIGRIVPDQEERPPAQWPDFEARAKKIFGDRVLPGADIVIEERGRY
jgi:hypothetical protein